MAYIHKEEIRQAIEQLKNDTDNIGILLGIHRVGSAIASLPTADVEEIPCRCRDCILHEEGCPVDTHPYMTPDDGYCSFGKRIERKTDNDL